MQHRFDLCATIKMRLQFRNENAGRVANKLEEWLKPIGVSKSVKFQAIARRQNRQLDQFWRPAGVPTTQARQRGLLRSGVIAHALAQLDWRSVMRKTHTKNLHEFSQWEPA
jgi:hypothetical protein